MDYQKFINTLPNLYNNWNDDFIEPKNEEFKQILNKIDGMTTSNVLQLLNLAVKFLEDEEIYCEIGTYQGSTLIGALMNNDHKLAYAVDDFSEFDADGKNLEELENNLSLFNLQEQVIFCNQDFEEFFVDLKTYGIENKIGVYFYDGAHDYRCQLMGLLLVTPFLANQALIIVDDTNFLSSKQANYDFLQLNPHCKLILDLPTPKNCHHTFWNGIQVFSWDIEENNNYTWLDIIQNYRNKNFLQYLYNSFIEFEKLS